MKLREKIAKSLWRSYCDSCGVEDNWNEIDDETKEEYRVWADTLIRMIHNEWSKDGEEMKKETEAERVAETIAALKARLELYMRSIESWKREEAEWEKERAGWLVTLDKSEHEGMRWKDRAEAAEKERDYLRDQLSKSEAVNDTLDARLDTLLLQRDEWIKGLLIIRDSLVKNDIGEAYHQLYKLADPKFTSTTPWKEWEADLYSVKGGGE